MKTSILFGLVEVFIVNLILITRCCGLPLQLLSQGNGVHPRLSRSIRARLCPEGTSSKRCFYSHLSMFMSMHEPLRDPSTYRTIGKRTMAALDYDPSPNVLSDSRSSAQGEASMELLREILQASSEEKDDVFDPKSFVEPTEYDGVESSVLFDRHTSNDARGDDILKFLAMAGVDIDSLNQYVNEQLNDYILHPTNSNNGLTDSNEITDSETQYMPVQKRQIVCPPGKTKLNCYNDAFSYYMQLLKTVGRQ